MIKLVAFDVDGTLRERYDMPETTRTAIRQLQEHGVQIALCTGRSEYEIADLRQELGVDWAITCNGSHIGFQGETTMGNPFPTSTVKSWIALAAERKHQLLLYGSEKIYMNQDNDPYFRQAQQEIGYLEPTMLSTAEQVPEIYQAIVFCTEEEQ